MTQARFDAWRRRGSLAGRRQLADSVRTLLFRADEELFDRFDFECDEQFLHPTLFARLTDPASEVGLAQTLYGVMPPARRPDRIIVGADAEGRAFLGPFGTLETGLPFAEMEFGRDGASGRYACWRNGRPVGFRMRAPVAVPGTSIQVTTDIDPLFRRFFVTADDPNLDLERSRAPRERIADALVAIALLQTHCPAVWAELCVHVRLVALYSAAEPNSFAALSAHGAVFCNLQPGDGELAVLEDMAHQGAHIIFNAFAHDPARLFRGQADTPVEQFADAAGDHRSLYVVLHALFTYALISRVLISVRESGAVCEAQAHELLGRTAFTMEKFAYDLKLLNLPDAYTPAGRRCYDALAAEFAALEARHGREFVGLDLRSQPYVFDYRRFVQCNGGPWPALCAAAP